MNLATVWRSLLRSFKQIQLNFFSFVFFDPFLPVEGASIPRRALVLSAPVPHGWFDGQHRFQCGNAGVSQSSNNLFLISLVSPIPPRRRDQFPNEPVNRERDYAIVCFTSHLRVSRKEGEGGGGGRTVLRCHIKLLRQIFSILPVFVKHCRETISTIASSQSNIEHSFVWNNSDLMLEVDFQTSTTIICLSFILSFILSFFHSFFLSFFLSLHFPFSINDSFIQFSQSFLFSWRIWAERKKERGKKPERER